jgi:cytochrome oxidase Cu insertion factor (SCO1/SenC/PrrC family)
LVVTLLVIVGIASGRGAAAERFVPLSAVGDTLPALPLVAQSGRPFALRAFRGDAVALAFIYTRCRDAAMCPLTTAKFVRAQTLIGAAPVRLVLLTLDPQDDTPAVLRRYGHAFGQDPRYLTFATGSSGVLDELAGRLGIATARSEPGTLVHTEAAVIVAPDGRIARIIDGNTWSAAELIAAARATLPRSNDRLIDVRAWLSGALERCGGGALVITKTTLLLVLAMSFAAVGIAFWLAFRRRAA